MPETHFHLKMTMARPMEIEGPVDQTFALSLSEQRQGRSLGTSVDESIVGDPDAVLTTIPEGKPEGNPIHGWL